MIPFWIVMWKLSHRRVSERRLFYTRLFYTGLFHRSLFYRRLYHKGLIYSRFDSEDGLDGLLKMLSPRRGHPSKARIFLDASHGEATDIRRRGTAALQSDRNQPRSHRMRHRLSYMVLLYTALVSDTMSSLYTMYLEGSPQFRAQYTWLYVGSIVSGLMLRSPLAAFKLYVQMRSVACLALSES